MMSLKTAEHLASLFEDDKDLPADNPHLLELIALLDRNDAIQLDDLESKLKKNQKSNPGHKTLLEFVKQYRQFRSDTSAYSDTLRIVEDNLNVIKKSGSDGQAAQSIKTVNTTSYFKMLELAGHHVSMYDDSEDTIHKACLKLDAFLAANNFTLQKFKEMFELEKQSQKVLGELDEEFQRELKGTLHSGDILQPSVDKQEEIIPGLHDNDTFIDKIYFFLKKLLTRHAHSALMVFDKDDNGAMHYSHVVDNYEHNKVELHHLLYSDIYRVNHKLFENKSPQNPKTATNPDGNENPVDEYRVVHENLYALSKEQASINSVTNDKQLINLENNTWRKISAGFINLMYRLSFFIKYLIAKDTDPDHSIRSVLTVNSKKVPKDSDKAAATRMFCSEFVANEMIIAAAQTPALCDKWFINRRARYLPPEALVEHLEKEKLVDCISDKELNMPLLRMFSR